MKLEQVAIATDKPQALIQMLSMVLGLENWATDFVKSDAVVFGKSCTNQAELNFNYDLGFEFEILKYTEGDNWHNKRLQQGLTFPFLSHLGYHCSEEEAETMKERLLHSGIGIAQEVWTTEHSNPVISGKRKYHYVVFDSREAFGFDLKLIVRIDLEEKES